MARRVSEPQMAGGNMVMVGADGGGSSFVAGEELKKVDVPIETLLGGVNGAMSGAIVSGIVSGVVSAAQHNKNAVESLGKTVMKNITGSHLGSIIVATAAFSALGALTRNARARKHNEWSDSYTTYLTRQQDSHADREDTRKDTAAQPQNQGR